MGSVFLWKTCDSQAGFATEASWVRETCYTQNVFDRPATAWLVSTSALALARTIKTKENNMKNLFVGNLDFAATESSIRSLFELYGTVDRVNVVTDRETGRARGFAFVEMSDSTEADKAISALNGTDMNGRALNVNEARPKTDSGRGGGGRPGGGGNGGGGGRQRREPRWKTEEPGASRPSPLSPP